LLWALRASCKEVMKVKLVNDKSAELFSSHMSAITPNQQIQSEGFTRDVAVTDPYRLYGA